MKQKVKAILLIIVSLFAAAAILCSCSLDFIFGSDDKEPTKEKLAVHFLDVGQGDSIFVELPNNKTMLIDAGENYHGEGIINYIQKAGYSKIDYLVATHPHSDHIGSLPYIVRNFKIGKVYMPKVTATSKLYESLLKSIKSKKLTVKDAKAGVNIVKKGDLSVSIIAPSQIDETNLNNCSIVIMLKYGDNSFLLTGDAETGEMDSIKADLNADVLKAGHHGSKNSTTENLLTKVTPEITVISCGKNNEYGHPDKEVLTLLKKFKSSVYRTDKNKTIVITSDGKNLNVSTDNQSIKRAS